MHPTVAVFPAVFALAEKLGKSGKELIPCPGARAGSDDPGGGDVPGQVVLPGLPSDRHLWGVRRRRGLRRSAGPGRPEDHLRSGPGWELCRGHAGMEHGRVVAEAVAGRAPSDVRGFGALLAEKDFIGARTMFEGPNGFIRGHSFKDIFDYGRITKRLGKKWEMMETSIKVHACCRFSGPVADCAMDLYQQGVRADDVKSIVAKVCDFSIRTLCTPPEPKYRPVTHVDAQFSIPWAVAVGVCKNRTGPEEFTEGALGDPVLLEVASKVVAEVDPEAEAVYPEKYPATLIATLNDGRQVTAHVEYPKGDPENPVSMKDILDKFNYLTEKYFDQARREKIIAAVSSLDEARDVSTLADLLR